MTLDQLKLIRDSYMVEAVRPDNRKSTRGEYMKLSLDGGIDLVTSKDLVVFDDANEMAHAVCINEDMRSQAMFPVKIISSEYAMIQQVETIMSQKNFEDFLKDGFISGMISAEKKEAMIKWTRAIKNQAQQPLEAEPYFNTNPTIIPMANSVIKRDEYKITVKSAEALVEILSNLEGSSYIRIDEDIDMGSNPVIIDSKDADVVIDLNGKTITSSASTLFNITDGALTINNGNINASAEAFRLDATGGTTPELVLGDDVSVVSETDCCIFIKGTAKVTSSADLTSNGLYSPIQGNGKASSAGTEINIIGGKIVTSADVGIYHPQEGILNLANCEIIAKTTVYIKAGVLNITSGKYTGTAEATPYKFNNNGCEATGDAIVVDFCVNPGGVPNVNITGGQFISSNAKAIEAYDKEGNTNPEIAKDNINIKGGSFSSCPNINYIEEGYSIIEDENTGICTVVE